MTHKLVSTALLATLAGGIWLIPSFATVQSVSGTVNISPRELLQERLRDPASGKAGTRSRFFAPFTCGFDPPGVIARVLPGQYASAVNIVNAGDQPVTFLTHVALTFPNQSGSGSMGPGPVSNPVEASLQPGEALEVDCGEVPSQFFPGLQLPPYIQGFVVISGPEELMVHVVHTAGQVDAQGGIQVVSLDVEAIEARPIEQ